MLTFAVALLFVAVHLASPYLSFLNGTPRSRWLSLGGGVSVAYVFAHLLPELAEHQAELADEAAIARGEIGVFLTALAGLCAFYALERYAKTNARRVRAGGHEASEHDGDDRRAFFLHVGSFGLYNVLIGYLLVHREEPDLRGLALYATAMALHFLVNDRSMDEHHDALYRKYGRWLLAGAVLLGWAVGLTVELPLEATALLLAFLAGGVMMNVMKEELPEERESRLGAFLLGAAVYTGLVLATETFASHHEGGIVRPEAATEGRPDAGTENRPGPAIGEAGRRPHTQA